MPTAPRPATSDRGAVILCSADHEHVIEALQSIGGELISDLRMSLPTALRGSDDATRTYVRAYRTLGTRLLAEARHTRADLPREGGGAPAADNEDTDALPWMAMADVVANGSAEAPFSPWTSHCELAVAVALDCTNRVRMLIGSRTLGEPAEPIRVAGLDDITLQRFLRRVRHHLNHPDDENPLRRIMELFALSKTELGGLFGVSRQAIDGWLEQGVPGDRQEKLATVLALSDLLERKLKPGRVPGIARRPADAYGGETMLSMIARDRQRELLDSVRASFDWSQAA
jgi:hypothetical protein